MRIDAHHHLWDLGAVHYPWLEARGVDRFFGDPTPIQRDYLLDEFRRDARGFSASVHIQVGAEDSMAEALWVQSVAEANPDWPMAQVVHADLTAPDLGARLDAFQRLSTLRGVRQIVGRAPGEDAQSGTHALLDTPAFAEGLRELARRGLSFDLQLTPELMGRTAQVLARAPDTRVALCHAGSAHDRTPAGLARWAADLKELSALGQVTCKLSGLGMFDHRWTVETIRPIVETLLEQFGPARCMFGSNFPVDSLYSDYASLVRGYEAIVPQSDWPAIFHETAARFYALP